MFVIEHIFNKLAVSKPGVCALLPLVPSFSARKNRGSEETFSKLEVDPEVTYQFLPRHLTYYISYSGQISFK